MTGLDRLIEPVRQFALARQRAIPFAVVIGEAADLPLRQFQIDQRQRGVGPGLRLDQPLDASGSRDFDPPDGKRRQVARMMSDRNSAVTQQASRSRSPSSTEVCRSKRSDMALSR